MSNPDKKILVSVDVLETLLDAENKYATEYGRKFDGTIIRELRAEIAAARAAR